MIISLKNTIATGTTSLSAALSSDSSVFQQLQLVYLVAYGLASASNNIQGSYLYVLLASYKLERSTIESLYLCTHISTFVLGTVTSSLSDKFGRRLACILSAVFYAIHCISLNSDFLLILVIGSVSRGIAHSLYNTNFEAWLIQAHHNSGSSTESFKQLLRNAFLLSAFLAVIVGIVAQFATQLFGYIAPFDIAVGIYLVMIAFVLWKWSENYGDKEAKPATSFVSALKILHGDRRIILLGMVTALFDATIYIFVIEWTPALQHASRWIVYDPLPLGLIFSCYMTFGLIGALTFKPLCDRFQPQSYMIVVIVMAAVAMTVPVIVPNIRRLYTSIPCMKKFIDKVAWSSFRRRISLSTGDTAVDVYACIRGRCTVQPIVLLSFCFFKFCVGLYMPSISLLRSQYLPDKVRATLMNYFRVPRFLFMFGIIVCHLSITGMFVACVVMLVLAAVCLVMLRSMEKPGEETHVNENMVLLSSVSTSSLIEVKSREPQMAAEPSNEANRGETSICRNNK